MSRFSASPRDAGFSLLEVLVAFVVLALVVVALFRLFSGALANASVAEEYGRALSIAESRTALAFAPVRLREVRETGQDDDGKFQWEVVIEPYVPPLTDVQKAQASAPGVASAQPEPPMAVRLMSVVTTVSWPGPLQSRRSVRLATLRLSPLE